MADPTTTWNVSADGKPVLAGAAPAPAAPPARTQLQEIADMGYFEGAANIAEARYRQQSQQYINDAVAASRAAEQPAPDGTAPAETLPAVVDGTPAVADVRAIYADSPSAEAREFLDQWGSFAGDLPRAQLVASQMQRSMGPDAWQALSAAFDGMSDKQQLEAMFALARQGTPDTFTNSRNERNMTQTTNPADLDLQIEQADREFYAAHDKFDRPAMARADAKRRALYAAKHPGSIVNGMGRLV